MFFWRKAECYLQKEAGFSLNARRAMGRMPFGFHVFDLVAFSLQSLLCFWSGDHIRQGWI